MTATEIDGLIWSAAIAVMVVLAVYHWIHAYPVDAHRY